METTMTQSIESFPNAPAGWTPDQAVKIAKEENIELTDDHWQLIIALQEYYTKVEVPKLRQVKDALNEKFHSKGGVKYLHQVIPGGPIAAGCKMAGLEIPAGAVDKSFGSVA
ncbi:MAG: TusE/DsrC/DsvC family sulfur relay protein [Gammaproteobacteria bacterium]|nr:TusE/DsrC/DsvC family sulfur relay protein [Gammaproteobacteria bacterium]